jgi:quinol monooxygenase YgiN
MLRWILAVIALGSIPFVAQAQTTKPAVGSDEVYWVVTVSVPAGRMNDFKQVVDQLVAATKEEPGALGYEYNASADQSTVDIVERYRDSNAAVVHVTQTFAPKFSKAFLDIAKPVRFVVYGTPTAEAKKVLEGFNPVYMTPFNGFTR